MNTENNPETPVEIAVETPAETAAAEVIPAEPAPLSHSGLDTSFNPDDFEALLNQSMEGLTLRFGNGQQVKGKVCFIDDKSVFINLHSRQEGVVDRAEFLDKEGNLTVELGSEVEAMVVSTRNDVFQLTVRMEGALAAAHLSEAFAAGIPVEGRFKEERKGGYTVDIGGVDAFCPYSQADLRPLPEGTSLSGVTATFIITQLTDDDMVVSRRKVLEHDRIKQKEALKFTLKVGDRLTGEVTRVMEFGAFVDIGGIEGMIPGAELSWSGKRIAPSEMLHEGDRAEVIIKAIDWDRDRITLSYRGAKMSWENIADQFRAGSNRRGTVTRIEPFGVFVELENDIEGLLHISQIAAAFHKRIKSPADVYRIGDEITVRIEGTDDERHRISLSVAPDGTRMTWDEIVQEFEPGTLCEGIITRLESYGAFVELETDLEGLLHISRIGNAFRRRIKNPEEVFKVGDEVIVEVESVDPERHRISLSLPEKEVTPKEEVKIKIGDAFDGIVKQLKPFGAVVDLGNGVSGLLHQSQTGDRVVNRVGDCLKVVIREIQEDGRKISLELPTAADAKREEEEIRQWLDKKEKTVDVKAGSGLDNPFSGIDLSNL